MTNPIERERIAREVAEELAREQFEKRYSWPGHLERNAAGDYTDYEVSADWGGFRDGFLCASDALIEARCRVGELEAEVLALRVNNSKLGVKLCDLALREKEPK